MVTEVKPIKLEKPHDVVQRGYFYIDTKSPYLNICRYGGGKIYSSRTGRYRKHDPERYIPISTENYIAWFTDDSTLSESQRAYKEKFYKFNPMGYSYTARYGEGILTDKFLDSFKSTSMGLEL